LLYTCATVLLQGSLTAVALGQLDRLKGLPGGSEGLLDLVKHCPIVAEVGECGAGCYLTCYSANK
jgi:hypothetical protein